MKFNVLLWLFLFLGVAGCKKENSFVRQENRPGYTVTSFDIPEIAHFQDGRIFYMVTSPLTIMQNLKESARQVEYPEKWKELVEKMNDEDSPVLIIGNLK